jgi:hypothetical protein
LNARRNSASPDRSRKQTRHHHSSSSADRSHRQREQSPIQIDEQAQPPPTPTGQMPGPPAYITINGTPVETKWEWNIKAAADAGGVIKSEDVCGKGEWNPQHGGTQSDAVLQPPVPCDIEPNMNIIDESTSRYVSVGIFRGEQYVKIRDYYYNYNNGKWCVGKRGINLTVAQWDALKNHTSYIDMQLKNHADNVAMQLTSNNV